MALCLLSLWKSPQHFQYWQEWNFQQRGAQEFHIFTRRASRNEWFNLMNFLSWKLALSQHDFPSPSSSRLLLKFSSQFFINTCFLVRHAQSLRSLLMHFCHHFKMSLRNYRSVKNFSSPHVLGCVREFFFFSARWTWMML